MNSSWQPDHDLEQRLSSRLLDVLIRAGLIGVLAALCYVVFAPFMTLMAWALILAVTLYPLHLWLAHRVGGRQGLAATLLVVAASVLIITPTTILMNSFLTSVQDFISAVQHNTLEIPPPRAGIQEWPIVGKKIYAFWSKATQTSPGWSRACSRRSANWPGRPWRWWPPSASESCSSSHPSSWP